MESNPGYLLKSSLLYICEFRLSIQTLDFAHPVNQKYRKSLNPAYSFFFSVAFLALAFFALALNSNPPELTLVTDLLVPPGKSTIIVISYFYNL